MIITHLVQSRKLVTIQGLEKGNDNCGMDTESRNKFKIITIIVSGRLCLVYNNNDHQSIRRCSHTIVLDVYSRTLYFLQVARAYVCCFKVGKLSFHLPHFSHFL